MRFVEIFLLRLNEFNEFRFRVLKVYTASVLNAFETFDCAIFECFQFLTFLLFNSIWHCHEFNSVSIFPRQAE